MANLSLVFDILAKDNASPTFRNVGNEAERTSKKTDGLNTSFGKMGVIGGAVAGLGIGAMFADAVGAASDLNETINRTNVIFGKNAAEVQTWARGSARSFGLSREAALSAATGFGNMLTQLGYTGDAALEASTGTVKLAADLGSFNNLDTEDVLDRIGAAMRGEYDSLQLLIPNINAARVEQEALAATGKAAASALTAQEKAAATLAIVQRDGAAAADDFAETAGGLANSQKILTAEWEDAKARLGELIIGPMTGAVQLLTNSFIPAFEATVDVVGGAVEIFGELPGPIQAGVAAAGLWAVAGGRIMDVLRPMGGTVGGLRGTWRAFGEALDYARANGDGLTTVLKSVGETAGGSALRGIKTLGRAIGPELAIGGAVVLVGQLVSGFQALTSASDDAKAAAEGLAESLTLTNQAMDRESIRQAIEGVDGLVDVLGEAGVSSRTAIDGLLGNAEAQDKVTEALRRYMSTLNPRLGEVTAEDARQALMAYEELSGGYDGAAGSARFFADESEGAAKGTSAAGTAAAEAAPAVEEIKSQFDLAAESANDAKKATDQFKTALDILTGAHVSLIEAESAFQSALAESEGAMKDLGGAVLDTRGNLNLQSESGRAAADILLGVRDSGNLLIATLKQQGATTEEVASRDAELRGSFIKTAREMGISEQAAEALADQILGIPSERTTTISTETQAARAAIDGVQRLINSLTGRTVEVQVRAAGRFVVTPGGGLQEFFDGGFTGHGGKFTPAGIVHRGEFVVPKERVDALGIQRIGQMVGMPGYAEGGPVLPLTVMQDSRGLEVVMEQVANAMREATKGGVAGSGPLTGAWGSIWQYVKERVPGARINSTFRAGDPGYHGRGKAIDFGYGSGPGGAGSAGLALINRVLHDGVGRNLAELIYDGIGDDRPDLKNGRPLTYSAGTRAAHRNHVHAAVYDGGGILPPGLTVAYNGTGQNETIRTAGQEAALRGPLDLSDSTIDRLAVAMIRGASVVADGRVTYALTGADDRGRYNG